MFRFFNRSKKVSFSKKMYWPLFLSTFISMIAEMAIQLSDEIIVGSLINENALIAISIISPIHLITTFVAGLIVVGTSFCYCRDIGEMDKKHANKIYSQGFILIVFVGVFMYIIGTLIKDYYLDFFGISGAVKVEVDAYWTFFKYDLILAPLLYFFEYMVYADGDNLLCRVASFFLLITRILFPIVFGIKYGIYGVGLGGALSVFLVIVIYCLHFIRKNNTLHFLWHLSLKEIKEVFSLSLVDSISMLCLAIEDLILNKFVINVYSEKYIPIVVIATAIFQFTSVFDCIGKSMSVLAEIYMGENNYNAERDLYIYSFKISIVASVVFIFTIIALTPTILSAYGISSELMEIARTTIYITMFTGPFISLVFIMTSQYLIVRKLFISVFGIIISILVFPITFALIFGYFFSFTALWIGLVFGLGLSLLVIYMLEKKYANSNQILKEVQGDSKVLNKSFVATKDNIVEVQNIIKEFVKDCKMPKNEINKLDLLIEEYIINVLEHNNNEVVCECSIIRTEELISVYLRDNGKVIDWSSTEVSITGLSTYVFALLVHNYKDRKYLTSSSYNRIVFHSSLES